VAGRAEGRVGRAEPVADERRHPGEGEGLRRDVEGGGVVEHVGQERRVRSGLARAHRGDEQDRQPLEPAGEVGEEAQRRAVAPVQVVDGEQQRALPGEVGRQPEEPVQRGERGDALAVAPRRAENLGGRRRGAGQGSGAPRRDRRLEELAHHPEAELALELSRARGQHPHVRGGAAAQVSQ
jgi:hypothetical protein